MADPREAIISIHGVHSQRILSGSKTVELRRRFPAMPAGSRLWIYETMPTGAVVGYVTVTGIEISPPEALWERHAASIGVTRQDFAAYLDGCKEAHAISLTGARAIPPIALSTLRFIRARFRAPQVMTLLSPAEGLALRHMAGLDRRPQPRPRAVRDDPAQFVLPVML